MTTRRSTLTADEKAILRHSRVLGLPVAIAMLRGEVDRQHAAPDHRGRQDEDEGGPAHERDLVALPARGAYLTKGAR